MILISAESLLPVSKNALEDSISLITVTIAISKAILLEEREANELDEPVRNMNLYERCRAYVVSAMNLLKSHVRIESRPNVMRITVAGILEDGVFDPLQSDFVSMHRTDISQLPEFCAYLKMMLSDATISKHIDQSIKTPLGTYRRTAEDYLYILLRGQFSEYPDSIEFEPERFDEQYRDLEQFLYTDYMKAKILVPICNFEMESEEVCLDGEVKLRRMSKGELREVMIESEVYEALRESEGPEFDEGNLNQVS